MGMFSRNYERRTLLRGVLFFIILATIPFYIIGFGIWLLPGGGSARITPTATESLATFTPLGGNNSALPSLTPLRPIVTSTSLSPLQATPPQFIVPVLPTRGGGGGNIGFPTAAPSLTPVINTDRDGDGIPDTSDACPDQAGRPQTNGCPDRDNDGIIDSVDLCPDFPGLAQFSGCPAPTSTPIPPASNTPVSQPSATTAPTATTVLPTNTSAPVDSDGDGILDNVDACPAQPGIPLLSGCPEPDSDGDGVPDGSDSCPSEVGTVANSGCP
jgi:hypothetical protein